MRRSGASKVRLDLDADRVELYTLDGDRYRPPTVCDADDAVRATAVDGLSVEVRHLLAG